MRIARRLEKIEIEPTRVIVYTDGVPLSLQFLTDAIVRIRTGFDGFDEVSYTLVHTAWEDACDSVLGNERQRIEARPLAVTETSDSVAVTGRHVTCVLERDPFRIRVMNAQGECVHADIIDLGYREDSNGRRIHTSEISENDCFYGFGEKTGPLNKARTFMSMSPKDALGYDPEKTDSLYKHMPFYIKLAADTRTATGYFYHNTWECDFSMGKEKSNYWPPYSRYRTDGGEIDLFLILGPEIRQVITRLAYLVGTSAMLPKAAYGYLGSSMYYAEQPHDCDEAIETFADLCEKYRMPMAGFQLSSGYTQYATSEGLKRCVFTWNNERFPDPARFFSHMYERGIVVSPNVKPGVLSAHPQAHTWAQAGLFVREADGTHPTVGRWWGGPGYFVDFTSPHAREYWRQLLTTHLLDYGATSIWNDNCEYDSIVDLDARCSVEGHGGTIGEWKSVMANLMCRESVAAIEAKNPTVRPFIVCRAGHIGIQRYAQSWAGDNLTCWEALRANIATILGMALCGVTNYGADIGGFYGPSPEPELLLRWVQNGIFHPRFSIHSVNSDGTVTEPWMYSAMTPHIRAAIELRYRLLPSLYSLAARAHRSGLPIIEPLCSAFQDDPACDDESTQFLMGDMLIATVLEPGAVTREVYFPRGARFVDLDTFTIYDGGRSYDIPVTIASIPRFLRSDGIICESRDTRLQVTCMPEKQGSFDLYQDDGWSNAYREGEYRLTHIRVSGGKRTHLEVSHEGSYPDEFTAYEWCVVYPERAPVAVTLDGAALSHRLDRSSYEECREGWYYSLSHRAVYLRYPTSGADHAIDIDFDDLDMLGM